MKTIIAGPRTCEDYEIVLKAIEKSGFEITEVVSGNANGIDKLGERYAQENKLKLKLFPADWNNLKQKGAVIATNKWGKKYNKNSGFFRNEEMRDYADALIAINIGDTPGTGHMIKIAKEKGLKVFVYEEDNAEDFGYEF